MGGCCIFTLLLAGAPRLAIIILYLIRPIQFQLAFNGWILPVLGFIFLPWLTFMYVLVAPGGLTLFEWLLMGLAFLLDFSSYAGGARARR